MFQKRGLFIYFALIVLALPIRNAHGMHWSRPEFEHFFKQAYDQWLNEKFGIFADKDYQHQKTRNKSRNYVWHEVIKFTVEEYSYLVHDLVSIDYIEVMLRHEIASPSLLDRLSKVIQSSGPEDWINQDQTRSLAKWLQTALIGYVERKIRGPIRDEPTEIVVSARLSQEDRMTVNLYKAYLLDRQVSYYLPLNNKLTAKENYTTLFQILFQLRVQLRQQFPDGADPLIDQAVVEVVVDPVVPADIDARGLGYERLLWGAQNDQLDEYVFGSEELGIPTIRLSGLTDHGLFLAFCLLRHPKFSPHDEKNLLGGEIPFVGFSLDLSGGQPGQLAGAGECAEIANGAIVPKIDKN